jgi:hypothetical protein
MLTAMLLLFPIFDQSLVLPDPVPTNAPSWPTDTPQLFASAMPSLAPSKEKINSSGDDEDNRPTPTVNQGLGAGSSMAIGAGALLVIGATLYARRRVQKNEPDFAPVDAETGESQS